MQKGEEAKLKLTADAISKLGSLADFKYHKMSSEAVVKHFNSDSSAGLSQKEAKIRGERDGLNELDKEEETSLWDRIKE